MMRNLVFMVGFMALAACGGTAPSGKVAGTETQTTPTNAPSPATVAPETDTSAATDEPKLAVEAEGLRLFNPQNGAARPIPFGTPRGDVLAALAFRGPPDTGTNSECGAGPLAYANWPDGLGLFFRNDKLAGWTLDQRREGAITTAGGIGPGSTRKQLEEVYAATISESTLGTEFSAGEIFGILDGKGSDARITNMWGGLSCNFR